MNWSLPVKYKTNQPIFLLADNIAPNDHWIRLLQKYFRINFETQLCSVLELYQKHGLGSARDLTTGSSEVLKCLKDILVLLNWHKKYGLNLEVNLIKENGESLTVPEILQSIYAQLNRKLKYLRWGECTNAILGYLPEILSLFPRAQFIQINADHSTDEMSFLFDFEHPLEDWIFSNLEYSKQLSKAKRYIPTQQIISFNSQSLLEKPSEVIEILVRFLQIEDSGRQLYRFILNNLQKDLTSPPVLVPVR